MSQDATDMFNIPRVSGTFSYKYARARGMLNMSDMEKTKFNISREIINFLCL